MKNTHCVATSRKSSHGTLAWIDINSTRILAFTSFLSATHWSVRFSLSAFQAWYWCARLPEISASTTERVKTNSMMVSIKAGNWCMAMYFGLLDTQRGWAHCWGLVCSSWTCPCSHWQWVCWVWWTPPIVEDSFRTQLRYTFYQGRYYSRQICIISWLIPCEDRLFTGYTSNLMHHVFKEDRKSWTQNALEASKPSQGQCALHLLKL